MKKLFAFKLPSIKEFFLSLLIFVACWIVIYFGLAIFGSNSDQTTITNAARLAWAAVIIAAFYWRYRKAEIGLISQWAFLVYLLIAIVISSVLVVMSGLETARILGFPPVAFYLLVFYRPEVLNSEHRQ